MRLVKLAVSLKDARTSDIFSLSFKIQSALGHSSCLKVSFQEDRIACSLSLSWSLTATVEPPGVVSVAIGQVFSESQRGAGHAAW